MSCENCSAAGAFDILGEGALCEICLAQIVREWRAQHKSSIPEASHVDVVTRTSERQQS